MASSSNIGSARSSGSGVVSSLTEFLDSVLRGRTPKTSPREEDTPKQDSKGDAAPAPDKAHPLLDANSSDPVDRVMEKLLLLHQKKTAQSPQPRRASKEGRRASTARRASQLSAARQQAEAAISGLNVKAEDLSTEAVLQQLQKDSSNVAATQVLVERAAKVNHCARELVQALADAGAPTELPNTVPTSTAKDASANPLEAELSQILHSTADDMATRCAALFEERAVAKAREQMQVQLAAERVRAATMAEAMARAAAETARSRALAEAAGQLADEKQRADTLAKELAAEKLRNLQLTQGGAAAVPSASTGQKTFNMDADGDDAAGPLESDRQGSRRPSIEAMYAEGAWKNTNAAQGTASPAFVSVENTPNPTPRVEDLQAQTIGKPPRARPLAQDSAPKDVTTAEVQTSGGMILVVDLLEDGNESITKMAMGLQCTWNAGVGQSHIVLDFEEGEALLRPVAAKFRQQAAQVSTSP